MADELASLYPKTIHLDVPRSRDARISLVFETAPGVPININGDQVTFEVKVAPDGVAVGAIPIKTNGVGTHVDPTNGETQFLIPRTELADAGNAGNITRYWYEAVRYVGGAGGERVSWFAGRFEIRPV